MELSETPNSSKFKTESSKQKELEHFPGSTAHQIIPNLFLGNMFSAVEKSPLKSFGITHIVKCNGGTPEYPEEYQYYSYNLRKCFTVASFEEKILEVIQFIDSALETKSNRVLIHCVRGSSRSGSAVIAYLMKKYQWSFSDSFKFVKKIRFKVDPERSLRAGLIAFEKHLGQSKSNPKSL